MCDSVIVDSFHYYHVVMVNKRSQQKRHRAYLRKIWYLRNFINLLKIYRAYLNWKHVKRLKRAIKWQTYDAICWKKFALKWNSEIFIRNNYKNVIYRFFGCQLISTMNVIDGVLSMLLLMHDELNVDKNFVIFFTHETVWSYCLLTFFSSLRARQRKSCFIVFDRNLIIFLFLFQAKCF